MNAACVLPVRNRYLSGKHPGLIWNPLHGYTAPRLPLSLRSSHIFRARGLSEHPERTWPAVGNLPGAAAVFVRTHGQQMERPSRQLLLSELRIRNTAYDVSLSRSLLTWKRRISSPVYHPFRPSKTRIAWLCVSSHGPLCLCVSGGLERILRGQTKPPDDAL